MSPGILPRFLGDRRGNFAVLYALTLPILIFGVGMAVDYTRAAALRAELNSDADAAVLAGVTQSMMAKTNDDSQAAAQRLFTGLTSGLSALVPGSLQGVPVVTNPTGNTAQRVITLVYAAKSQTIFSGILGVTGIDIGGSSVAKAAIAANIDFYVLLDNTSSMALPSTQDGIDLLTTKTVGQDSNGAGCAFACHQAQTDPAIAKKDVYGNPYWIPNTTFSTAGCAQNKNGTYPTGCVPMDDYAYARNLGIKLRLDEVSAAVTTLMDTATQTAQSVTPAPTYRIAVDAMATAYTDVFNNIMPLTTYYQSNWPAASKNLPLMEVYINNQLCVASGNNPCASGITNNDVDTSYDNALSSVNAQMPDPGTGANGAKPQEVLFIVTDGVEDESVNGARNYLFNGTAAAWCDTIKTTRKIRIAILYTTYLPIPNDPWYRDNLQQNVAPHIAANLQACASPGLFYQAGVSDDLSADLKQLFQTTVASSRLTQ